jgi:GAF domain-containing protein
MAANAELALHDVVRAERFALRQQLWSRRGAILADTAERIRAGENLDREVMPALYRALAAERFVDATLGFVVTEEGERMSLGFMEGFDFAMVRQCLTLDFGQAICGTVAATRRAMHVTNIQRSLDPIADLVRSRGITAYACEPLLVDDRLLGTISFASRCRTSFDAEDLRFFRELAQLVARARDRARACDDLLLFGEVA